MRLLDFNANEGDVLDIGFYNPSWSFIGLAEFDPSGGSQLRYEQAGDNVMLYGTTGSGSNFALEVAGLNTFEIGFLG